MNWLSVTAPKGNLNVKFVPSKGVVKRETLERKEVGKGEGCLYNGGYPDTENYG